MKQIYHDVMLEKIILNETNSIILSFYDDFGNVLQNIKCQNIMCMNYSNSLLDSEEVFPCLVLNVEVEMIHSEMIVNRFNSLKYGFTLNNNSVIPFSNEYWYLIIEGGPIFLEIISSKIIFE